MFALKTYQKDALAVLTYSLVSGPSGAKAGCDAANAADQSVRGTRAVSIGVCPVCAEGSDARALEGSAARSR